MTIPISGEIWFKVQRVLRTAVQVTVAGAVTIAGSLAVFSVLAPQVLSAVADVLPAPVVLWLTGFIASVTAISAALARVMAIPAVDAWLKRIGLGSAPKNTTEIR